MILKYNRAPFECEVISCQLPDFVMYNTHPHLVHIIHGLLCPLLYPHYVIIILMYNVHPIFPKKFGQKSGWCGSVDWVLAFEPKGHWFNSQSEHMPGLQARSPVRGVREATTHWCFSPSPSLPTPLFKIQIKSLKPKERQKKVIIFFKLGKKVQLFFIVENYFCLIWDLWHFNLI